MDAKAALVLGIFMFGAVLVVCLTVIHVVNKRIEHPRFKTPAEAQAYYDFLLAREELRLQRFDSIDSIHINTSTPFVITPDELTETKEGE